MSNLLKILLGALGVLALIVGAALLRRSEQIHVSNASLPSSRTLDGAADQGKHGVPAGPESATNTVSPTSSKPLPPTSDILRSILIKYRDAYKTRANIRMTRIQREFFFGLREARLACLVDPSGCERIALELLQSGGTDPESSALGLDLLGYLAKQGLKGAESALAATAASGDPELQRHALRTLYEADGKGAYQSLYLRKAREGDQNAIRLIGTWPDPQALPVLKELIEKNPGLLAPASSIRLEAEAAIEREEMIESPRASERILEILSGKNRDEFLFVDWAIRVAQIRPPASLASICRERLDAGRLKALEIEAAGMSSQMMKPGHTEVQFLSAPHVQETNDRQYDEILLLMAGAGGDLSNVEQKRLRFLGYAGDPRTRLAELLNGEK